VLLLCGGFFFVGWRLFCFLFCGSCDWGLGVVCGWVFFVGVWCGVGVGVFVGGVWGVGVGVGWVGGVVVMEFDVCCGGFCVFLCVLGCAGSLFLWWGFGQASLLTRNCGLCLFFVFGGCCGGLWLLVWVYCLGGVVFVCGCLQVEKGEGRKIKSGNDRIVVEVGVQERGEGPASGPRPPTRLLRPPVARVSLLFMYQLRHRAHRQAPGAHLTIRATSFLKLAPPQARTQPLDLPSHRPVPLGGELVVGQFPHCRDSTTLRS